MTINSIKDYCDYVGSTVQSIKRDTYKYTDCGAWIDWDDDSISIGSIVEGSNAEFSRTFDLPCTTEEIDDWFEELERLTDEAWHEANDDPDNDYRSAYRGDYSPSNPWDAPGMTVSDFIKQ